MHGENRTKTGGGRDVFAESANIGAQGASAVPVETSPTPRGGGPQHQNNAPPLARHISVGGDSLNESDLSEKGTKNPFHKLVHKMGCGTTKMSAKGQMPVVVFGATGTVGGAVARALLKDERFCVRAVTRTPTTDEARALAEEGAVVVAADLNDSRSLMRVMEGAAGVFLTTNYWEHLNKQKEITHGMNAIDAAVNCKIHHFVFLGSSHTKQDEKPCGYMDGKAALEEYISQTTLAWTSIRFPFLYENLLSLFKPHLIKPGGYTLRKSLKRAEYVIPIPMENNKLDCMALQDAAKCIYNVFIRPKNMMQKHVSLTGERMTIQHMADILDKNFDDKSITYVKISPEDFGTFDFQGCQDIAAWFENLKTAPARDHRVTRRIFNQVTSLDAWTNQNRDKLLVAMDGGEGKSPR